MAKSIQVFFVILITITIAGCRPPAFSTGKTHKTGTKQIVHQTQKWQVVGKISKEHPNPMRVLMIRTKDMGEALHIMKKNSAKYSTKYFRSLPSGASIYISKDNELFINKKGGAAPDETVTSYTTTNNRKEESCPEKEPSGNENIDLSEIKEEDLTE